MKDRFDGEKDLISILVPTRKRPLNVIRLVDSALQTASEPSKIEFLFYVDEDDSTFKFDFKENTKVKVVAGPRTWISLTYNVLYTHSSGEILMYGADDIVFNTVGWDKSIRDTFDNMSDKICLVYANDGVDQSQSIARHGFIHRRWFNITGTAFPSMRNVPIDLWCTEIAKKINRLRYLEDVVIEHVHFRQGKKALVDQTYLDAMSSAKSWDSKITYKKLNYEMRVDVVLLSEHMESKTKVEADYIIGEFLAHNNWITNRFKVDSRRLKTTRNLKIFFLVTKKIPVKFFHSVKRILNL